MEILQNLVAGLGVAATPENLLYCLVGVALGTAVGVLPGIGPVSTIALLLPITFGLAPASALIMLAGIYYGAQYGGSTAAILVNVPGEVSSAVTCVDGYQMARQGRAAVALGTAALGSFAAGCVGTAVVALFAPALARIALLFGPVEYFSLMACGLAAAIALSSGSAVTATAMALSGVVVGLVGIDATTGVQRFTFGMPQLSDGINFVTIAVGLFGFAEIVATLRRPETRNILSAIPRAAWPTGGELRAACKAVMRGTSVGVIGGAVPGSGAMLSSFAAYALEKNIARDPSRFGRGAIEGVAAPEAANNAAAQTSFIPLLTLGIPSNAVMALMLGAMTIHGIVPGPELTTRNPELFWGLVVSMWIGNMMLLVLNMPLIGLWVRLLSVPYRLLFPAVALIGSIGVYSVSNSSFDLLLAAAFGLLGYLFIALECDRMPFLLGFVLGPLLEEHLRRAMLFSRGDPVVFVQRPVSLAMLVLTLLLVAAIARSSVTKLRSV